MKPVYLAHKKKNSECHDEKIDDSVEKQSVIQRCGACRLRFRDGSVMRAGKVNEQIRKIDFAEDEADGWHQDIVDK